MGRIALGLLAILAAACSKDGRAASQAQEISSSQTAASTECNHAACGSNYFIDAVPPADCAVGAKCAAVLKLVATGQFHVNEDYPYKLKADDAPGLHFLGTDAAGTSVFSKTAGDWQKADEKSGMLTMRFLSDDKGTKTVGGTFKLSVCSAQNCQLEQQQVKVMVAVR